MASPNLSFRSSRPVPAKSRAGRKSELEANVTEMVFALFGGNPHSRFNLVGLCRAIRVLDANEIVGQRHIGVPDCPQRLVFAL